MARATALLAVADGQSYTAAAQRVGRHSGDTVARWVARFNQEGLAAVMPRHGGGSRIRYAEAEQQRILAEVKRMPERARDGNGDVVAEHAAGRLAPSRGRLFPAVSTYTIWRTLHAAELSWQKSRTWCQTGVVTRKCRHGGTVTVTDSDAMAKKS